MSSSLFCCNNKTAHHLFIERHVKEPETKNKNIKLA